MKKRIAWSVVVIFGISYISWMVKMMVKMMVNTPLLIPIILGAIVLISLLTWSFHTIINN